jgi:hypothetical protein
MKSLRFPHAQGGEVWLITHDLMFDEGRRRRLRPIHVFTWLAQHLNVKKPQDVFWLCLALENKLFAVRHFQLEVRASVAQVGDPVYARPYVQAYEDEQKVIATLEAYLAAIYTTLEITAEINRFLHTGLRIGFREQAKKFPPFSFEAWPWLPHFYDVRSELTHFNTPLPSVETKNLLIEFRREKRLNVFKPGRHEISFEAILTYLPELFRMLDAWAADELKNINKDLKIKISSEPGPNSALRVKEVRASQVLKLLRDPKVRKQKAGAAPAPSNSP